MSGQSGRNSYFYFESLEQDPAYTQSQGSNGAYSDVYLSQTMQMQMCKRPISVSFLVHSWDGL